MTESDALFNQICKDHMPLIQHIARSYEHDHNLAEDLTQDILLAIWRSLPKLKDHEKLKPYIARIAQNRAITHVTRMTKVPKPSPALDIINNVASNEASGSDALEQNELGLRLRYCVGQLSPKLRRVAVLALSGFANKEIALSIGERPNTIAVKLRRAKAYLTTCVAGGTND